MDREATLSRLLERAVLVAEDGGESLAFGDAFEDAVADHQRALEDADAAARARRIEGAVDDADTATLLTDAVEIDSGFVACAVALAEQTELPADGLLELTVVLQQFRGDVPAVSGVPEGFLPVAGDQLETVLALFPRAVLYVWKEDCEPCDLVVESLEAVFEEPPGAVAPLAVRGADCAELLRDRFDVAALPTTLFLIDGAVDSRLVGAYEPAAFAHEIAMITGG